MRCLIRLLPALALLILPGAVPAQLPETALNRFLEELDTLSAAFEQTLYSESGEELEKSLGILYLQRPGRFHWAYWEPYPQLIISDGLSVWIFDEDLEQVTIRDVLESVEDSPSAILGGAVQVDEYYIVIDLGEAEQLEWVELTPRDIEAQYASIRLGFDDGLLGAMVLYDDLGQMTRINFLDVQVNPVLDPDLFRFTPPPGVDVIDTRGNASAAPGEPDGASRY